MQLEGVVGDEQLLLADQLVVVAVLRAVEHLGVVGGADAAAGRARRVVGDVRREFHPTLAGQVAPGTAADVEHVHVVVDHQLLAGLARRSGPVDAAVFEGLVGGDRRIAPRLVLREGLPVGEGTCLDHPAAGVHQRRGLPRRVVGVLVVLEGAVPHHFRAVLRNRERHAAVAGAGELQKVLRQRAGPGVLQGVVDDVLRVLRRAMGRVDIQAVGRILLQHFLDARAELVLVLRHVLRGDAVQRLLAGEGVGPFTADGELEAGGYRNRLAIGRDGAVGIAGLLRAPGQQVVAQAGDFVRAERRPCRTLDRQGAGQHRAGGKHLHRYHLLYLFSGFAAVTGGTEVQFSAAPCSIHRRISCSLSSGSGAWPKGICTPEPPASRWVPRSLCSR
ncbi:hypothetical protein D3C76_527900 [compost metagenome]